MTVRLGCVALVLAAQGCASDDGNSALEESARTYLTYERINAAPFPTAQHQGRPEVNVWANDLAAGPYRTLSTGSSPRVDFPPGAMIVKEMLDPAGAPPILTVMAKQPPGYDPDHDDWWYGRLEADGRPTNASFVGTVSFCIACHTAAPDGGYVYGVAADNLTSAAR